MATVFEAVDTRLDRRVALKVPGAEMAGEPGFVEGFHREALAVGGLSHPNVVTVYDWGQWEGRPYLAMEYVEGPTLRQVLVGAGPLEPSRALALWEQVLAGLSAVHEVGLVHRDVKPENVLIAGAGLVKVADFGLARAAAGSGLEPCGALVGTACYLAPEVVTGGPVDARADVYAAGITLYEMVVGFKPHGGGTAEQVAYRNVHVDVPLPSRIAPSVPGEVDGLVAWATARDPESRPADAGVLLRHLRRTRAALPAPPAGVEPLEDLAAPAGVNGRNGHVNGFRSPQDLGLQLAGSVDVTEPAVLDSLEPTLGAAGSIRLPDRELPADEQVRTPGPWVRRARMGVAGVVALAVVGLGGCWLAAVGPVMRVPDVVGVAETRLDEIGAASGADFVLAERVFDDGIRAGHVARSVPRAGTRIVRGDIVRLWVSRGPERAAVPNLAGVRADRARSILTATGLRPAPAREVVTDQVGPGRVVRTEPAAGTRLLPEAPVVLVVSKGTDPAAAGSVSVPDVRRLGADEARRILDKAGFAVEIRRGRDYVGGNVVVDQSPAGGRPARRGSTVVITLA